MPKLYNAHVCQYYVTLAKAALVQANLSLEGSAARKRWINIRLKWLTKAGREMDFM